MTATKHTGRQGEPTTGKPMAIATRIALFEREVRERLSATALDLLFERAQVISEGQRERRAGRDAYFGSTMLTIDLPAFSDLVRDTCDAATAKRLAERLGADGSLARRVETLTRREVERLAGARPKSVEAHTTVRAQGARVFIDVDVEAAFP